MILEAPEMCVCFACDKCGELFEARKHNEADRQRWIDEGWRAKEGRHICGDCAIRYMPLHAVQRELRSPKPNSTAYRRQQLWRRLDVALGLKAA